MAPAPSRSSLTEVCTAAVAALEASIGAFEDHGWKGSPIRFAQTGDGLEARPCGAGGVRREIDELVDEIQARLFSVWALAVCTSFDGATRHYDFVVVAAGSDWCTAAVRVKFRPSPGAAGPLTQSGSPATVDPDEVVPGALLTVVRDGPALAAAVRAGKADADSGCWEELRVDANRCVALGSGSLPEGVVGYTEFLRILREISPS